MSASTDQNTNIEHVYEEMYKKNLELATRNKTLSLLRRIDEIILDKVTDMATTAQSVATAVVDELGLRGLIILLYNSKTDSVTTLAVKQTNVQDLVAAQFNALATATHASKLSDDNAIIKVIREGKKRSTNSLFDLFTPQLSAEKAAQLQVEMETKSFLIYPLIVRGEVIGVMIGGLVETEDQLSADDRDLIDRLSAVVGIAIDNAMLYASIQDANTQLKELDKLKNEFVSVASHELRTPMTAIRSYLWMALKGKGGELNEKQKYYLDRAYISTSRLIKLVNDMLNISRIESGRIEMVMSKVELPQLTDEVISEVKPRADELNLQIVVQNHGNFTPIDVATGKSVAPVAPPAVLADTDKIKEVIINLIGNSMKFTPAGGTITIWFELKGNEVITHVRDNGRGINAEDLPKLFQKFGLIASSYVTNQIASQGTGLGLYISKQILKLHKGDIWVTSPGRDKGAEFSFSLPVFQQKELEEYNKTHHGEKGIGIIHSTL